MRRVWAIARNTFVSAVRMKTAMAFMLLLIVLLPVLSFATTGDGTIKGRLQSFISYGLSFTGFVIAILTIIVSCYSLSSDIKNKQIYTLATKPLRRFEIILGKLFGVLLLDLLLLTVFSSVIYALTLHMPGTEKIKPGETAVLSDDFFTARKSLSMKIDMAQIEAAVIKDYQKLLKSDQLDRSKSKQQILRELRKSELAKMRSAGPGGMIMWEYENVVPSDSNQSIFIRFKYNASQTPADKNIFCVWYVGDYRQIKYGNLEQVKLYQVPTKEVVDTTHEISVPAEAVSSDGYLAVIFYNDPVNDTTVIFPRKDGLEVLYKAGTFSGNFLRAVILMFLKIAFLAGFGVSLSAWLSFPVAVLCSLTVYCIGIMDTFIVDSFNYMATSAIFLYSYTIKPLIWLLPQFGGDYSVAGYMINAKLISVEFLFLAALSFLIKALIILAIGMLIFSKRELAKISV